VERNKCGGCGFGGSCGGGTPSKHRRSFFFFCSKYRTERRTNSLTNRTARETGFSSTQKNRDFSILILRANTTFPRCDSPFKSSFKEGFKSSFKEGFKSGF